MNFPASKISIVKRLYQKYGIPLDKLPYTTEFEEMMAEFAKESRMVLNLKMFYTGLLKLRKSGKLGKLNGKDQYEEVHALIQNPRRTRSSARRHHR